MEPLQHRLLIEIIRNTDDIIPFARAKYPDYTDENALQRLALDELREADEKEIFEYDSATVVGFNDDADLAIKKEIESRRFVKVFREFVKKVLSSNSLTEEIRKEAVQLFDRSTVLEDIKNMYFTIPSGLEASFSLQDVEEIKELMKYGNRIPAIKRVREITKWSLLDSKDFINNWESYIHKTV